MAVHKLDKTNLDAQIAKDLQKTPVTSPQKKIVDGRVTDNKKNMVTEIFSPIIGRAISDMVVTAMATISDIVIGAVDMRLYGENRHTRSSRSFIGRTNYNSLYRETSSRIVSGLSTSLTQRDNSTIYRNPTNGFRLQEVIVPDRGSAELVIDTLSEKIDQCGVATVGDYYDAVGIQTQTIDFKYGWYNLTSADKRRTLDGYLIIMPTPKPLD